MIIQGASRCADNLTAHSRHFLRLGRGKGAQARYTQLSGNPRHGNGIELAGGGKKIIWARYESSPGRTGKVDSGGAAVRTIPS